MAKTKDSNTISFRKMLTMTPEELRSVSPDMGFQYIRGKDLAKLSDEQLFALHPDQVKALRPIQFAEIEPNKLRHLLALLERQVQEEVDVWYEPMIDKKTGQPRLDDKGEQKMRELYGARETIRRAIPKAETRLELERKNELLRESDAMITAEEMDAKAVAAKLDISLRFLDILGENKEIKLYKTVGRHMVNVQSVVDYLNRQRRPGAQLDAEGKPIKEAGNPKVYVPIEDLPPITSIPNLYSVEHFASKLDMDPRSFIRNCNEGYYDHFHIGSVFKMSEEDFERSVKRQIAVLEKKEKKGAGRPLGIMKA